MRISCRPICNWASLAFGGELFVGGVEGLRRVESGSKSEFWVKEKPDVTGFSRVDYLIG